MPRAHRRARRPSGRSCSQIDPAQALTSDSSTLNVTASASPDGRFGLVGWSVRTVAGWEAGVDVVDLSSLQVVDRLTLPKIDLPTSLTGQSWVRLAPWVDLVGWARYGPHHRELVRG